MRIRLSSSAAAFAAVLVNATAVRPACAAPVISEILYRPGTAFPENTGLEFIEIHNPDTAAVDISGWAITSGVGYTFPAPTVIPAGGYLVVAADPAQLQAAYPGLTAMGPWAADSSLSNNGEKIALSRPGAVQGTWTKVDDVTYATEGDWGQRIRETVFNGLDWSSPANGGGKSMELRNPALSNDNGQNWAPSTAAAGGTPGAVNTVNVSNIPPVIHGVKHSPAVPRSTDSVTVSCEINDETGATAVLYYRDATSTNPGAFLNTAMVAGSGGKFSAVLPAAGNRTIIEFYVSASDGTLTRTWPPPTGSEGQNANCVYQVDDEIPFTAADTYRLNLTAADNRSWENLSDSSDRQYNMTLITQRGTESTIRYRASMRTRGNSSRGYQFRPIRVGLPGDNAWDGVTSFNLQPRSPHLQHLGMRLLQASGLPGADTLPVELRRNGVEYTTSSGSSADYGRWARVEPEGREFVQNHWPAADTGNLYTKRSPEHYWRSSGWTVPATPDGQLDNWSKQNNGAANNWTDLTRFFSVVQSTAAPHFPGASPTDVSQSNGNRLSGTGAWDKTGLNVEGLDTLQTVADTAQWARFFAVMTILQDYETNISNGVDDDYGIYFRPGPGNQRLAQLVPHDLDTIVGMGDSPQSYNASGLYDMTEGGESGYTFRTLLPLLGNSKTPGNPDFRNLYLTEVRKLLGTVFDADTTVSANPPFYQFVDAHLAGWAPAATIASIKEFVRQRRIYLLDLIADGVAGGAASTAITPPEATAVSTVTSAHSAVIISEVLAANANAHEHAGSYPDVIELRNTGNTTADLAGMSLSDDPGFKTKFVFAAGTVIAPGQHLVIYADSAFSAPGLHSGFQLDQSGDAVFLYDTPGNGQSVVDSVSFGLQAADFSIGRTGAGFNTWALCVPSIGAANPAAVTLGPPGGLRINEWLSSPDFHTGSDFLEVFNPSASPVAMGGMRITDDLTSLPARHVMPALSFIRPEGFQVFKAKGSDASPGNPAELPFSINSSFGFLSLAGDNGTVVDSVSIISQRRDESTGRSPDGAAALTTYRIATPGISNTQPPAALQALIDSLRISEILYKPDGGNDYEFIELTNIGDSPLDLSGVRFTGGIDYTFPAATLLNPGRFIVVGRNRAVLLGRFPLAGPVLAPGNYTGALDNSGETITLSLPEPWDAAILSFAYNPAWEPLTFSSGYSLTVINPAATAARDWEESDTWTSSETIHGTPGGTGVPAITSSLSAGGIRGDSFAYAITATHEPSVFSATGLPPGLNIAASTGLISGTPVQEGVYSVSLTAANSSGTGTATLELTVSTSGPLHHFTWNFSPPSAEAGVPFPAWITAQDAAGRTVTGYNATAALTAASGATAGTSPVMITEVTDEDEDQFELQNTGSNTVNTSGWFIAIGHSTGINALNSLTWPLPSSMAPGQLLRVSENSDTGRLYFGGGISWTTATAKGWIMLLDATSTPRDFFAWGWTAADLAALSVTLNGKTITAAGQWSGNGSPLGTRVNSSDSWQRTGARDHNNAADWVFSSNSTSWSVSNPGLSLPWETADSIAVSPAAIPFTGGSFTGFLTIGAPAAGVRVTVADSQSPTGNSALFDIVPAAADTDGDRMPDLWEAANGLSTTASDATADPDKDGFSNLMEYYAGTDPRSAASRLVISSVSAPTPSGILLTWPAAANRLYKVRQSTGHGPWTDVPGQIYIPAANGIQSAQFPRAAGLEKRGLFRVELLTPP